MLKIATRVMPLTALELAGNAFSVAFLGCGLSNAKYELKPHNMHRMTENLMDLASITSESVP
jgi:hypothetical protein